MKIRVESIDLTRLKDEVISSKKKRRMTEFIGEAFMFLAKREVNKQPTMVRGKDEHISEVLLRSIEKFNAALKTKGKLIVKGFTPEQVLSYLIGMIRFATLEHRSFIFDGKKRVVKGKAISLAYIEDMPGFDPIDTEAHYFDEAMDYEKYIEHELNYV